MTGEHDHLGQGESLSHLELCSPEVLVLGCGNPLYGDDGFGPEVVRYLKKHFPLPPGVRLQEVGTLLREVLLEVGLSPSPPKKLIIVDAVKLPGRSPGEVFELDLAQLPRLTAADLSIHQFPPGEFFRNLKENTGMALHFLLAQGVHFPQTPEPGLSGALTRALPEAARRILALL